MTPAAKRLAFYREQKAEGGQLKPYRMHWWVRATLANKKQEVAKHQFLSKIMHRMAERAQLAALAETQPEYMQ